MNCSPSFDRTRVTLVFLTAASSLVIGAGAGETTLPRFEIEKCDDSVVDSKALNFLDAPFQEWSQGPNGLSFQQDAIATFGGYQYATYWDADRWLCVGRRKLPRGPWEVIRFGDYRIKSNDVHNVTVLGICPCDGTIHLAFDHHNDPLHYRVSQPGAALHPGRVAWAADLFGKVLTKLPSQQEIPNRPLTYPRFFRAPDGNLQLYFRLGGSCPSGE